MSESDEERIEDIVSNALNRRIVGMLRWIILASVANLAVLVGSFSTAIFYAARVEQLGRTSWTITMQQEYQWQLAARVPAVSAIDIHQIKERNIP